MDLRQLITNTIIVLGIIIKITLADDERNSLKNDLRFNDSRTNILNEDIRELQANVSFTEKNLKCRCDGGEALLHDGITCVATSAKVPVYDFEKNHTTMADPGQLQKVKETIQCTKGHVKATLAIPHDMEDQFSLLPSGHLNWEQRQFQLHCIEHLIYGTGNIKLMALGCIRPPSVPLCCSQGQRMSANFSCGGNFHHNRLVPAIADKVMVSWDAQGRVEELNCLPHENLLIKYLSYPEAILKYSEDRVSLVWSPRPSSCGKKEQTEGFCVAQQEGRNSYIAQVCYEDKMASHKLQCDQSTCVRKCCGEREVLEGNVCTPVVSADELWTPSFYDSQDISANAPVPDNFKLIFLCPICEKLLVFGSHVREGESFKLLNDGYLYLPTQNYRHPPTNYCLDNVRGIDGVIHAQALVCHQESNDTESPGIEPDVCIAASTYVYPALMLVSCVFLAATLITFTCVPDLRKSLNGKCLISLVSALLVGYLTLATVYLTRGNVGEVPCRILASVIQFTLLASFFWQNIMWIDMWMAISQMRMVPRSRARICSRFLKYSLYSWGCPLVITIIAVIMEVLPDTYNVIRPEMDTGICWFGNEKAKWLYFYGIIALLLTVNAVFFVRVAYTLCRCCRRGTLQMTESERVSRERMVMCVKLFFVMGICWLAEVPSWKNVGSCYIWLVPNFINGLQGLSIFIACVCKRNTYEQIRTEWNGSLSQIKSLHYQQQ